MVAGILVGMAVPSFKTSVQNNRLVTQANDLLSMLLYARTEAITNNKTTVLCVSSDQATCTGGSHWEQGWLLCQPDCSASTNILRVESALAGGNTLSNASNLSTITFSSATGSLTTNAKLYFDLCDTRGASYGRGIYIYAAGLARASSTPGKQLDGTALSC
jgi:type IV fimbrial biogenesis protein FimT